jgi:ABC-type uncharacterized transport system substrate-binding protein
MTMIFLVGSMAMTTGAHPHLFIDVMAKFMFSDSTLSGVNVFWDIDEMSGASLIEEFDFNHNGSFEKNEYDSLYSDVFSWVAKTNYYMEVTCGNSLVKLTKSERFVASILPDLKVRYAFFIPFNIRITDLINKKLIVLFEDPSMFAAFELKKKMISAGMNSEWKGVVSFEKEEYYDLIVLKVEKRQQ